MIIKFSINSPNPPSWMVLLVYAIPYIILFGVAIFWPSHHSPFGLDFTHASLTTTIPSIKGYVEKSEFPHATAAFFFISGLMVIPYFILSLVNPILPYISSKRASIYFDKYKKSRMRAWVALIIISPIMIWGSWIQPGYQFKVAPISDQRWALAIFGLYFSFFFQLALLATAFRCMLFFEKILNRGAGHSIE